MKQFNIFPKLSATLITFIQSLPWDPNIKSLGFICWSFS